MAFASAGVIGRNGSFWIHIKDKVSKKKDNVKRVHFCKSSYYSPSSVVDPYKTLRIQPGASESEVRKAFRKLALQVLFSILNSKI